MIRREGEDSPSSKLTPYEHMPLRSFSIRFCWWLLDSDSTEALCSFLNLSLRCINDLPYCLLSYGTQVSTFLAHLSPFRRNMCPAYFHFSFLTINPISVIFIFFLNYRRISNFVFFSNSRDVSFHSFLVCLQHFCINFCDCPV